MLPGNHYWFNCFQFIKIMIDKLKKKCYNNYRKLKRGNYYEKAISSYFNK